MKTSRYHRLYVSLLYLVGTLVPSAQWARSPEIIVKFVSSTPLPTIASADGQLVQLPAVQEIQQRYEGLRRKQRFPRWPHRKQPAVPLFQQVELWELADSSHLSPILQRLQKLPQVEYAEPNRVFKIRHQATNDPDFDKQWYLARIGATLAWDYPGEPAEIIVGVIDTGVDYWHEDLREHIWVNVPEDLNRNGRLDSLDLNGIDDDGNGYVDDVIGWDFTDAPRFADHGDYLTPDNDPMDEFFSGHGTPVAGLIAAVPNNGLGIAGVAPAARIMILRAGTASGYLEEDDVAEAILYAVDNGCRIVNLSFGDVAYSYLLRDVIRYGAQNGVLFVAAAGNNGSTVPQYPAAYDETISVGATNEDNARASFSSYGAKLDLVAPGQGLWACQIGNSYGSVTGTSFAAPLVSGALAVLWGYHPDASPQDIKAMMLAGCKDLETAGWDSHTGHGLVNIDQSLQIGTGGWSEIRYPQTHQGVYRDTVYLIGTATGARMLGYRLAYGPGDDPQEMHLIGEVMGRQVLNDTLGVWLTRGLPDSVYTLELRLLQYNLPDRVFRTRIFLDRSAPRVTRLTVIPMVIRSEWGYFVEVETDDPTTAILHLKTRQKAAWDVPFKSPYLQTRHYFLLESSHLTDSSFFWLEVENPSGKISRYDNLGSGYRVARREVPVLLNRFQVQTRFPVSGYLMPFWTDFDRDGRWEVVLSRLDEENNFGVLEIREIQGESLLLQERTEFPAIPRDAGNVGADDTRELVAGYGKISLALSSTSSNPFPDHLVWADTADFWVSRLMDVTGDDRPELLAIQKGRWTLLEFSGTTFSPRWRQFLENPTEGDNRYGIPWIVTADLDGDSLQELIFGDYDGDVVVQEVALTGEYHPVAWRRLSGADATALLQAGDVNGDGREELVAVTSVQPAERTESSAVAAYWVLQVLRLSDEHRLDVWTALAIHGVQKGGGRFQGLQLADVNLDGKSEILFAAFPRLWMFSWQDTQLVLSGYREEINANAILVKDVDQDGALELMVHTTKALALLEYQDGRARPLAPNRVRAVPLDTRRILVEWSAVPGVPFYRLYRGEDEKVPAFYDTVYTTSYIDTLVHSGTVYTYRVSAVQPDLPTPESALSPSARAIPNPPPEVDTIRVVSPQQLELIFSEPMGEDAFRVQSYMLFPLRIQPISVARGRSSRTALISFDRALPPAVYRLAIASLPDQAGTPLSLDTAWVDFRVSDQQKPFYVKEVRVKNKSLLEIEFNHPVNPQSAADISHYQLIPDGVIQKAVRDSANPSVVYLMLDGRNRLGALGVTYQLNIQGVQDIYGNFLEVPVQPFLLLQQVDHLEEIFVYPNPYRLQAMENELMFGKVPGGCEIFIYSAAGELVGRLRETDGDGGVAWDLTNLRGRPVGSGVYFFVAKYKKQMRRGKFLIIR